MIARPAPAPVLRGRRLAAGLLVAALTTGCAGPAATTLPATTLPAAAPVPATATAAGGVVPAALELPELQVRAGVQPSAAAPDGELAVPEDPQRLGWWVGGARPGDPTGTAVVAGHVDSALAGLGAFAALRDTDVGDPVTVRAADGTAREFVVTDVLEFGKQNLPAELFTRDGPPRLALITCTGAFDRERGSYADNLVVLAAPAPDVSER